MTISDIKSKITSQPNVTALTRLIADNWIKAEKGLCGIVDDDYRGISVMEYPLQMLCIVISQKEDYAAMNSGEKELLTEKTKRVFEPVSALLSDSTDLMQPTFAAVAGLIPDEGEKSFFDMQLKEDFKRLDAADSDSLALVLYGIVYAFYREFDWTADRCIKTIVGDPFEIGAFSRMSEGEQQSAFDEAVKTVYRAPQTNAATASAAVPAYTPKPRKMPGKWRPLKIYLIATTLFVALVVGLVFWSMESGVGASGIGVTDVNGMEYSVEPGMNPVELPIFGMADYDGIISIIKNFTIGFVIWRVLLITAVFIFNYKRRQGAVNHP